MDETADGPEHWHRLPLRAPIGDDEKAIEERDVEAEKIGNWLMEWWTTDESEAFVTIEWVNCHEHALVNTFDAMGKAGNERVVKAIGPRTLAWLKRLQDGSSRAAEPDGVDEDDGVSPEAALERAVAAINPKAHVR